MKKISNWVSVGGGAFSSILGIIGAALLVACPCKVVALSAILVAVFGAGAAAFIKQYNYIFIIVGVVFFAWGAYSLLSSRKKKCKCCEPAD
jgi:hypothetical protein